MISIVSFFILFVVFKVSNKNHKEQFIIANQTYQKKNLEKFKYLIFSGDNWLKEGKYHNAIFQYKLALDVFPKNKKAINKLLEAYEIRCKTKKLDCNKKSEFLKKSKPNS